MTRPSASTPRPLGDTTGACDRAALGWVAQHLDDFAPPGVLEDDSRCKPLLELLVLMVHRLREGASADPCGAAVLERLAALASSPALRGKVILNKNQLVLRAGMCTLLRLAGRPDHAQERVVQHLVDTGLVDHSERLPHHVMIERTVLDWGGFHHDLPTLAALTGRSLLVRRPDALHLTRTSAYELTHDIMFGCAFGEREAVELAPERERLHRLLSDALVRFQHEGHWDLVGELLMCWDSLDLRHDGVYDDGWRAFTAMQHADGSTPAIAVPDRPGSADQDGAQSERERFDARYHTTLVSAFAAIIRSRRERGVVPPPASALGWTGHPSAARTDVAWLDHLIERRDPQRAPRVLVSALIGLTLIAAVEPTTAGSVDDVADRIRAELTTPDQLVGVPATQTLTAFGILRERGADVPAITTFVDAIRTVVTGTPPDAATALAWHEKVVALSRLGLSDPPAPAPADEVWRALSGASGPDLTAAWQLAGAATGFGTARPPVLSEADLVGVRRLEALGVDALRRRDLITGCALLRGAHALRPLHPERLDTVCAFLRAQQSPDGGYGSMIPVVPAPSGEPGGLDADVDARLPISLAVWWALAELSTDFRMFAWPARARAAETMVPS